MPRWSEAVQFAPVSSAGLFAAGIRVGVEPPLYCSAPSNGSAVRSVLQVTSGGQPPWIRVWSVTTVVSSRKISAADGALSPHRIELLIVALAGTPLLTSPWNQTPPPAELAVLALIVTLRNVMLAECA